MGDSNGPSPTELPGFFTRNTGRTVFDGLGGLTLDGGAPNLTGAPATSSAGAGDDGDGIDFSQLTAQFMAPLSMEALQKSIGKYLISNAYLTLIHLFPPELITLS